MKLKTIIYTIIALVISCTIFFTSYAQKISPNTLYHVYLSGKTIGYIESKKDLEDYIDKKEEEIKVKYNVKNVYMPKELKIEKENTYLKKPTTVE